MILHKKSKKNGNFKINAVMLDESTYAFVNLFLEKFQWVHQIEEKNWYEN